METHTFSTGRTIFHPVNYLCVHSDAQLKILNGNPDVICTYCWSEREDKHVYNAAWRTKIMVAYMFRVCFLRVWLTNIRRPSISAPCWDKNGTGSGISLQYLYSLVKVAVLRSNCLCTVLNSTTHIFTSECLSAVTNCRRIAWVNSNFTNQEP